METAKRNGKLESNYRIPDQHRNNTPRRIADDVATLRSAGLMPAYPTGSDFSEEELLLQSAFRAITGEGSPLSDDRLDASLSLKARRAPSRMGLDNASDDQERNLKRQLMEALARVSEE